jgi:aminoglycoside phosphotransferase (APT) family kinase protein
MAREHRVITALRGTGVPVPRCSVLCEDTGVLGAPFYVMERMQGTPYRSATELAALGPVRTQAISTRMVEVLAELHPVNVATVGLSNFGRPDGFLARQVRRWRKQLDVSRSRELAGAAELCDELMTQLPMETAPTSVHVDYRLDNLLVDPDDRVTAGLDWEMATIGDPLTDVALLLTYERLAEIGAGTASVADACTAAGFLTSREILDQYAAATGRDLSQIGWYLGLAHYKLAVIIESIHYRYTRGQTVGEGFDAVGARAVPLIASGLASITEHSSWTSHWTPPRRACVRRWWTSWTRRSTPPNRYSRGNWAP